MSETISWTEQNGLQKRSHKKSVYLYPHDVWRILDKHTDDPHQTTVNL